MADDDARYNRHRFDNYSAWLDRAEKEKRQQVGKPFGWGYAAPKPVAKPKPEKPFYVLEPSFTSSTMTLRKYNQIESAFPCENERADGHHYPNAMNLQDEHHYGDYRRRSQHHDPSRWKPLPGDKILRDAVSDEMVTSRLQAEKGETRKPVDPKMLALLNDEVRLSAHSVRELQTDDRVDFSCMTVPTRDHPSRLESSRSHAPNDSLMRLSGGMSQASKSMSMSQSKWALSGAAVPPPPPPEPEDGPRHGAPPMPKDPDADHRWKWCLGGRKPPDLGPSEEHNQLVSSRSVPVIIPGKSLLVGNMGNEARPFHGLATRTYGPSRCDPRMRGGSLARGGWAGTFPEVEAKK
eukprot:TRINITY_DN32425_c0_g1_i1.p1 TRINITY_DN32425_c0_g1~~TRINITY_DN32425_c0_g1_i1.p1  ORF type:complete len:350 (+),score=48.54 TRINITY_DN32425_c0_g1_i1:87-1136(+)